MLGPVKILRNINVNLRKRKVKSKFAYIFKIGDYRAFLLTRPAFNQIYWNKRKHLHEYEKSSTPTGLDWNTNMATISLLGTLIIIARVTSHENTLLIFPI